MQSHYLEICKFNKLQIFRERFAKEKISTHFLWKLKTFNFITPKLVLGRSVNPISTRGAYYANNINICPHPLSYDIFRPSYGPAWPGVGTYEQCVPPCPVHTFTEWERELFPKKSKMNLIILKFHKQLITWNTYRIYNLLLSFLMLLYRMDQKVCYNGYWIRPLQ